jgi:hypothetical protein
MAFLDLYDWALTALVAALLAASLSLQDVPAERSALPDAGVCEKPGIAALGAFLPFH